MTYNLINQHGFLIKQFINSDMKAVKEYIKDNNIINYIILKTQDKGGILTAWLPCLVSFKAV